MAPWINTYDQDINAAMEYLNLKKIIVFITKSSWNWRNLINI